MVTSTHVVTLANSIVGVSVLAMPFCFKYCGVVLATLMLITSAIMTRIVCYFLVKAGVMTKRRSYEMLAYHTFGYGGKLMVEITLIGFLVGTLIAFLVVIGDLGPPIVAEIFNIENNHNLRTVVMTGLALFVALPLGLLRDIESLGSVSTISFLFYLFLVLKILNDGFGAMEPKRMESLSYWAPSGVLQCIPIFAMALSCQTQIFSIYESLPDPSIQKMNEVVKSAVYLCTGFYFSVGFFGYMAFSTEGITGNILMSFGPTWTTQLIKVCFVLSIAFSVPLCIFPCRASLYSLLFKGTHTHHSLHDSSTNYIPEGKLRLLTILIVGSTLVIALLIPNIELVLGLVGSTAGSIICLIFPSAMFIKVMSKKTTERLLAQVILVTGICIMVLTTYATLYAVEKSQVESNLKVPEEVQLHARISADEMILQGAKDELQGRLPLPVLRDENIVHFEPKKDLVAGGKDVSVAKSREKAEAAPGPPELPVASKVEEKLAPPPPPQTEVQLPVMASKLEEIPAPPQVPVVGPKESVLAPPQQPQVPGVVVPKETVPAQPQEPPQVPGVVPIPKETVATPPPEPQVPPKETAPALPQEPQVPVVAPKASVAAPPLHESPVSQAPPQPLVYKAKAQDPATPKPALGSTNDSVPPSPVQSETVPKSQPVAESSNLSPSPVPLPVPGEISNVQAVEENTKELLDQLKKQREEQHRLIAAQQKILDQLKVHKDEDLKNHHHSNEAEMSDGKTLKKMKEVTQVEKENEEKMGKLMEHLAQPKNRAQVDVEDKGKDHHTKELANPGVQADVHAEPESQAVHQVVAQGGKELDTGKDQAHAAKPEVQAGPEDLPVIKPEMK